MPRPKGEVGSIKAQKGSLRSGTPTSNVLVDEMTTPMPEVKEPPIVTTIMAGNNIVVKEVQDQNVGGGMEKIMGFSLVPFDEEYL